MTATIEPARMLRIIGASLVLCLVACQGQGGGASEIRGSARLPQCTEDAALDLDGSTWLDTGTITTSSTGCSGADIGATFASCTLQWLLSQQGREISITVDNEYSIAGRMCGDRLHLEGGWWLPVADEAGRCTYSDEDASEVGIEEGGSELVVSKYALSGKLRLQGACTAEYEVTFSPFRPVPH